ncbi:hypothetical protein ABPG72_022250 [Tetrahymena utriculariae]
MLIKKALQNIPKNAVIFQNKQQMKMSHHQGFIKHFENDRVEVIILIDVISGLDALNDILKNQIQNKGSIHHHKKLARKFKQCS